MLTDRTIDGAACYELPAECVRVLEVLHARDERHRGARVMVDDLAPELLELLVADGLVSALERRGSRSVVLTADGRRSVAYTPAAPGEVMVPEIAASRRLFRKAGRWAHSLGVAAAVGAGELVSDP
jgi:hypothetical protein